MICNAHRRGISGQIICPEPVGIHQFRFLNDNVAASIFRRKRHHERIGKRPGLAAKIADIFHFQAQPLPGFPGAHTFLAFPQVPQTPPTHCTSAMQNVCFVPVKFHGRFPLPASPAQSQPETVSDSWYGGNEDIASRALEAVNVAVPQRPQN